MLNIMSQIPFFKAFRAIGRPRKLPLNLTISPSFKCNSRCRTCNIYKKQTDELSVLEWAKVFEGLGKAPFWVTISGGEPFLNKHIVEIATLGYDICKPAIINIPTNGLLTSKITDAVEQIASHCKTSSLVINVSMDAVGKDNDAIRGIPGSYDKAVTTFKALKRLKLPNLSLGIHTVISRYNVDIITDIYTALRGLEPDSYITEIAEERVELDTIGTGITPATEQYARAADFLIDQLRREHFNRMGRLTRVFRMEYYRLVKRILQEHRQVIPCYAGFASAQIAPNGDVWMCCIRAEPIGNLKQADYRFKDVWFSAKAQEQRRSIKAGECYCPLANAGYTNMLHSPTSLFRVMSNFIPAPTRYYAKP